MQANKVLLLKSEKPNSTPDKYESLLTSHNFKVIQVKTLNFIYKNIHILKEKLLTPDKYEGIIFSSPRCVNSVSQALGKSEIEALWGQKMNFTVGETTFQDSVEKLGVYCKGKESGNAKNLAQIIIKGISTDKEITRSSFCFRKIKNIKAFSVSPRESQD